MTISLSNEKFKGVWNCYAHLLIFGLIYFEWSFSALVAWQIPGMFTVLGILCLLLPLMLRINRIKLDKFCVLLIIFLIILTLINCLRDEDYSNNALLITALLSGFFVSSAFTPREFGRVFGNVVLFLALFSLPVFFLSVMAPSVIDRLPLLASSYMGQVGTQVHSALFAIGVTHSPTSRNCGIAWEPGAFSILLCVALYFALLFPRRGQTATVVALVITELTTLSTMGIAVMCAILFVMFIGHSGVKKSVIAAVVVLSLLAATFMGLMDFVISTLFSKLGGLFDASQILAVTTQDRINAIVFPLRAFVESPLFGVGYERFIDININQCQGVATNTFTNWLALMGCLFGLPCCVLYFRAIIRSLNMLRVNKLAVLVGILAAALMLTTEDLIRISLVYIIIFYGCMNISARSSEPIPASRLITLQKRTGDAS